MALFFFLFYSFFANLLLSLEDNSWFLISAGFPSAAVGVVSVEVYEAHPALSLQTRFLSI